MNRQLMLVLAFFAVLLVFPLVVEDTLTRHLMILAFVYAVIASNWDLSLGYAGLFNFAHPAFFGIGIYAAAIPAKHFDVNPWIAMLFSPFAAALLALLLSLPIARLKGIYVVLITFAFSQLIVQVIVSQSDFTGGTEGLARIPFLSIGDYKFIRDYKFAYYYTALAILMMSTFFLLWLVSTPFGKSLRALRDNEDYALSRGISVMRQRIFVLVASAVFTGLAGGFFAFYLRVAATDSFRFGTLSLVLSMVLIGGVGTIVGPIIAALVLTFASESLAGLRGFEEARFILIAVGMILVLRFAPEGLLGIAKKFTRDSGIATSKDDQISP